MANFPTHITVSTSVGIAYGVVGSVQYGVAPTTSILAGGLCALGGMLPDLDSDNSTPVREMLSFTAAAVPMHFVDRFRAMSMTPEEIVLTGAGMYIFVRFVLGAILKRWTVHRGMFHSFPALAIAFLATFLLCPAGDLGIRIFKASGLALGFFSHLLLDEIWAIEWGWTGFRFKKSFGTAMKFFGQKLGANSAAYGVLILLSVLVLQNLGMMSDTPPVAEKLDTVVERVTARPGAVPK